MLSKIYFLDNNAFYLYFGIKIIFFGMTMNNKLSLIILLISTILFAQSNLEEIFTNKHEVYFRFNIENLEKISQLSQIISIDDVRFTTVYAYANKDEFTEFLKHKIAFEILPNPSSLIEPEMSNSLEQIAQWNVYPTYEAYVNMMYQFQNDYPNICKIVDAGNSVQGRKILFAVISDNVNQREPEPQFMYTSTMHGDETTGYVLMLRLIDSLLTSYGSNSRITNLVNNAEIWINPLANPDGTYRNGNNTVSGATRYNANNFDLNRNFPDPINGVHSSQQIETTRFRIIQEANNFSLIANFHGGAEVVNYPWDRWVNVGTNSRVHADQTWYQYISRLYADTSQFYSPAGYMTYLNNGITNGGAWYVISGGRQDYTNWYRLGREVTVEISNTKLVPATQLPSFWEYNKRSFLNFMEHIFYGFRGIVTDTLGNPIRSKITLVGFDYDSSFVYSDPSTGFYSRMVQPGNYRLSFQAPGYYEYTTDFIQMPNYRTGLTINVQLTPITIPVELISFSANVVEDNVHLYWSTATETNNSGFEIHRKLKQEYSIVDEWKYVGFIKGNGTSAQINNYSFIDKELNPGKYLYRLKQIDYNGSFDYSKEIEVEITTPMKYSLEQNYPNPFSAKGGSAYEGNIGTTISWQSAVGSWQTIKLYNALGEEIDTIVDGYYEAGKHSTFYILNSSLPSGVYFYQLRIGDYVQTKKMILNK